MKKIISFLVVCTLFSTLAYAEEMQSSLKIDQILEDQRKTLENQEQILKGQKNINSQLKVDSHKNINNKTSYNYTQLSTDEKVILVLENQKKLDQLLKNQGIIYEKIENDPFKDKNYGIELNMFRFLFPQFVSIAGTFSLFYPQDKTEIAFPFTYTEYGDNVYKSSTMDIHYRKFLGDTMNGFYLSGFVRSAYLEGELFDWSSNNYDNNDEKEYGSEFKLGVGFGFGYRIFSKSGIYWGTSLSLGRYLIGQNNQFYYSDLDDTGFIIDFELLKFGYGFSA